MTARYCSKGSLGAESNCLRGRFTIAAGAAKLPSRFSCGALPEDLLEQELFGGMSGGPDDFFRAQGGTVVVEEMHHLPLRLQSQLDRSSKGWQPDGCVASLLPIRGFAVYRDFEPAARER